MQRTYEQEHWKITDTLYRANGDVITSVMENTVVNGLSKFLGALFKGQAGINPSYYFTFGEGLPSWDSNIPDVDLNSTKLTTEIYRKLIPVSDIHYLDEGDNITASITNKIRMSVRLGSGEGTGRIREFGIMAGNATSQINSGILINKKHHALVTKGESDILERSIIIVL
jgi:hypothetical protein